MYSSVILFILVSSSFSAEFTSTEGFETKQSPIPITLSFSQPVKEFDASQVLVFLFLQCTLVYQCVRDEPRAAGREVLPTPSHPCRSGSYPNHPFEAHPVHYPAASRSAPIDFLPVLRHLRHLLRTQQTGPDASTSGPFCSASRLVHTRRLRQGALQSGSRSLLDRQSHLQGHLAPRHRLAAERHQPPHR